MLQNKRIRSLLYHSTPFVYELYRTKYLRIDNTSHTLSLKTGRPYKSLGLNISAPSLYKINYSQIGLAVDVWLQGIFSKEATLKQMPVTAFIAILMQYVEPAIKPKGT